MGEEAEHSKFIYDNTYTFKNNFIKINAKNYCVISKKTPYINNTKNVTYLLLDTPEGEFNSNNINNLTITLANSYDKTTGIILIPESTTTHTHAHMHPHDNDDPIYHTKKIIDDGKAVVKANAKLAADAKSEADRVLVEAEAAAALAAAAAATAATVAEAADKAVVDAKAASADANTVSEAEAAATEAATLATEAADAKTEEKPSVDQANPQENLKDKE